MPPKRVHRFRLSHAPPAAKQLNNFPGGYPVELWHAHYWSVAPDGKLESRSVVLELPEGYAAGLPVVRAGEPGCISHVRSWGVRCSPGVLSDIGFDATPVLPRDPARFPGGEDQEWMYVFLTATTFDLPADFIIADQDYTFLLFAPNGDLKGSWVNGPTYLAALTWIVSNGKISADFAHLQFNDRELYARAVAEMLAALPAKSA